jgi:hypothetical protein
MKIYGRVEMFNLILRISGMLLQKKEERHNNITLVTLNILTSKLKPIQLILFA